MQINKQKAFRNLFTGKATALLLAVGLSVCGALANAASAPQTGPATKSETHIGEYSLQSGKTDIEFGVATITGKLSTKLGQSPVIESPQYRIAAQTIEMLFRKAGKTSPYKATSAIATGSVKIDVKDPDTARTTTLTCNKAIYTATTAPNDRGKIDLLGHVHSVTRDPSLAEPLVQDSDSITVRFTGPDTYVIGSEKSSATATPVEPASSKKKQ